MSAILGASIAGQAAAAGTPSGAAGTPSGATGFWGPVPPPVVLTLTGRRQAIPRSFFGLSMEANEINTYETAGSLFDRVVSMIRAPDGSPLLLRVGGKSTDDAYWKTTPVNTPSWVFEIGDNWMSQLSALVKRDDMRVMLDVNLPVHSTDMATQFATDALSTLPRGALAGFGVGNEPDLYNHQLGLQRERVATTLSTTPVDWAQTYSPDAYRNDYRTYAQALLAAAPHVPLEGPDITSSTPRWISAVGGLGADGPSLITMHRYPFSTCWKPTSPFYPTIDGLLAKGASTGLARRLRGALLVARAAGLQLRVSELNSVSCGGNKGVANSFATALWAPDALFELMQVGVIGVNWHIRPNLVNAPFHFDGAGGIEPFPELYGLALFSQMLGPHAQLETVNPASVPALDLKAWAVRSRDGLKLLLINKGPTPAVTELPVTSFGATRAQVMWLKARSVDSTTGVTLGGQTIGSDARWHGQRVDDTIRPGRGLYRVRVSPYTAALISFPAPKS